MKMELKNNFNQKNTKFLGVNLMKGVKELHSENYKRT